MGRKGEGGSASAREKTGVGGDGRRAGEKRRERERKAGVGMVWAAKNKPANHDAESA